MIFALIAGGLAGLAAATVLATVRPLPPALADVFASFAAHARDEHMLSRTDTRRALLPPFVTTYLARSVGADLAILGISPRSLANRRAVWATGSGAGAAVILGTADAAGAPWPPALALAATFGLSALGFVLPVVDIRRAARRRRADFLHALAAYVDLVAIAMAGGMGLENALASCADIGGGWAFETIRGSLNASTARREAPWVGFARLANNLRVPALAELAGNVTIAGTDGARVTETISARAESLRAHAQASMEAEAHSASELMTLPLVLMLMGLVVFVGYPALSTLLSP